MVAESETIVIPKKFLCRRCNYCGNNLRPDGLVDCQISETPVVPVERSEYKRFEDCPQRTGEVSIPGHKLRLLASFARRVKGRDGPEVMSDRLESAESVIRSDLRITARLKR